MGNCSKLVCLLAISIMLYGFHEVTHAAEVADNPIEAGNVRWGRDLDWAITESGRSGKPVLALFQEIPGCSGCQDFGRNVLQDPLLVEAIESEFLPVLIYNKRQLGKDREWLERYREPSWNFQVIRFLDGEGKDIIARKDRVWTIAAVTSRMIMSLEKLGRAVPQYLKNLVDETDDSKHNQIGFAMACFWTGEYRIGKIDGVISTEAGWLDNREVTLVTYHTGHISLEKLVERVSQERCADRVYLQPGEKIDANRFVQRQLNLTQYKKAKESDQKKQLEQWPTVKKITTLTPMQVTKLNAFVPDDMGFALSWLSPRQRAMLEGGPK